MIDVNGVQFGITILIVYTTARSVSLVITQNLLVLDVRCVNGKYENLSEASKSVHNSMQ
jgi:hypothetical protein